MLIHLALSLALGFAFACAVWIPFAKRHGPAGTLLSTMIVLAGVWAINFLAVLPAVNPIFATLLPPAATLLSKLLFGVSMAAVLELGSRHTHGRSPGSADSGVCLRRR